MPKVLEDRLKAEAAKKGFSGERADRYVYGGIANIMKRKKGKRMGAGEMQRAALSGGKP